MRFSFCILLFSVATLSAEPWGKDADLVHQKNGQSSSPSTCSTPVLGTLGELLISFHQNVISPADGPRSHFIPSSSQYTLDAMRKYGFFQGFMMGCDRLMRENPEEWVYRTTLDPNGKLMKFDPVR
jgi:uncharacterized protein